MIKKIIALAVAFALFLAVPLYDVITKKASPVEFGAGDGVAEIIDSPETLKELISNIPDFEAYLETDDITEDYPDFKTMTMIENGKNEAFRRILYGYGENAYYSITKDTRTHVLEMYCATNAIYYHAIGQMRSETVKYDAQESYNEYSGYSYYIDESDMHYEEGTSSVTVYDIEIVYSKDATLVRFNSYDMYDEESDSKNDWSKVESDEDDMNDQIKEKTLEVIRDNYGKWMKIEEITEEYVEDLFGDKYDGVDLEDPTDPNAIDYYLEYSALEIIKEIADNYIESIETTNKANMQYLVGLAGFLTEDTDDNFNKKGNRYVLDNSDESKAAYLSAVIGYNGDVKDFNVEDVSFNIDATDVLVKQKFRQSNYSDSGNNEYSYTEVEASSTFKNVGNTVVNLKDIDVDTMYDALADDFKDLLKDILMEGADD